MLGFILPLQAGVIHVDPAKGNDRNDGGESMPLQSVAEGLKRAREWRRLKSPEAEGGITIQLAEGNYTISEPIFVRPEDSGTADSPTVIKGPSNGNAIISGGKSLTGWKKGNDDKRLKPELRNKVWTCEAPRSGNRIVDTRQLYVDGKKAVRAVQFAPYEMARMVDFNTDDCSITVPSPAVDLSNANELEMIVHQRWAIAILRVKDIKEVGNGNVKVTFHDPESRLEFSHPWPQPVIGGERGNSSYTFVNALELLDEPGEWFQDYPSGTIYYYPREGEDMAKVEVVVPMLENLLSVKGTHERNVHDIKFENVTFSHAAWTRPSKEGHVTLQGGFRMSDAYKLHIPGLPEKAELENQAWIERPESAVSLTHCSGIDFQNCNFKHLGATGLDYVCAVKDCSLKGSVFEDIGGNGILVGAFPSGGFETHVPYIPHLSEDLCRNITIEGNTVRDATNEDWGCVGIGAGYVRDMNIIGNEVADVNYSGICVGWGWTALESGMANNKINGNHVHDFAKMLYDAGGIYTLSYQPGSEIKGNLIEGLTNAPYATNERAFYIYFDEATDGYTVEGNKCPEPKFGYNRPGPQLKVGDNGPHIELNLKAGAHIK